MRAPARGVLVVLAMSTTLLCSLALALGLSACVTDDDDEPVASPDDQETVATDPGADLGGEPSDPNVVSGSGTTTCGGQPRLKADGPCVPN